MIYIVTYFTGKRWVEFVPFTVEEYAINFMNKMKKLYPDLEITVKEKKPTKFYLAAAIKEDISENLRYKRY